MQKNYALIWSEAQMNAKKDEFPRFHRFFLYSEGVMP